MSETKRGAPTEDGCYEVLASNGNAFVLNKRGGHYQYTNCGACLLTDADILAHRPHVPLDVPPLRELHRCEGVPCVVRNNRTGNIYYAVKFTSNTYDVHDLAGGTDYPTNYDHYQVTPLTRAECEAAGFHWPIKD